MIEKTKTKWGTKYASDDSKGFTTNIKEIYRSSLLTNLINVGLLTAGGAVMYGLGMLAGEIAENLPYINEMVSQGIECISGLNLEKDLSGVGGLAGSIYGMSKSGIELDTNTMTPSRINIGPICIKPK